MTTRIKLCSADEVAVGAALKVETGDLVLAVFNVGGQFYAIDDLCTHDGGSLDQGELEGEEIECPRHGARFNVTTGDAVQLPAFEPVETHEVRVEGESLQVGVEHR